MNIIMLTGSDRFISFVSCLFVLAILILHHMSVLYESELLYNFRSWLRLKYLGIFFDVFVIFGY